MLWPESQKFWHKNINSAIVFMNTVSLVAVAKFRLWEFRIKRRAHLNASNTDLKCCQPSINIGSAWRSCRKEARIICFLMHFPYFCPCFLILLKKDNIQHNTNCFTLSLISKSIAGDLHILVKLPYLFFRHGPLSSQIAYERDRARNRRERIGPRCRRRGKRQKQFY